MNKGRIRIPNPKLTPEWLAFEQGLQRIDLEEVWRVSYERVTPTLLAHERTRRASMAAGGDYYFK